MKTCASCKQLLHDDAFSKVSSRKDGLSCSCKVCTKKQLDERIKTGRYVSTAIEYARTHTSRTCTKCHRDLPLCSFHKDNRLKSGLYSYCKECMAKAVVDYRKTPRGKASAVAISLRYQATDRGKEMVEKWENSDNGKASAKKKASAPKTIKVTNTTTAKVGIGIPKMVFTLRYSVIPGVPAFRIKYIY